MGDDGTTVVVVINRAAHSQSFDLHDSVLGLTLPSLSAPAHSIQTYVYQPNDNKKVETKESWWEEPFKVVMGDVHSVSEEGQGSGDPYALNPKP